MATRNLSATGWGYVRKDNPGTHYTVRDGTFYPLYYASNETLMFVKFAGMPSSLKRKQLLGCKFYIRAKNTGSVSNRVDVRYALTSFDPATITWNSRPDVWDQKRSSVFISQDDGEVDAVVPTSGDSFNDLFTRNFLQCSMQVSSVTSSSNYLSVSNKLAGGVTAYLAVTYDDAVNVLSKVTPVSYPTGTVHAHYARTFSWKLEKADSSIYCADETWTQASATLYWKKSTASSYTAVNISGPSTQVTVPANTFPTGSTVQWYIRATDTDGTTTQTTVRTFTTYETQVTPIIYPAGSAVDNRVAQRFTWNFTTESGDTGTPQSSAKLYWRVSGAGSWNVLNITGTTKAIDVPAYTFPANSTIEFQIEGTDYSGATSTSETLTFKTLAYSLAISSAPTGSNIDTRNAITFSWTISNAQGAVNQSSAIFYWRVSGASSYTQVSVSGSTKSVSIPANTFPTGKTIQWYVRVTAADGTVLTSSAATFNTVSTRVTLDTYPSGNDVYTAAVLRWTWHLASNVGNYSQASAKLYWRVSTSSTYTAINVSGNTQALNVPANTFPTNKTIQWYVEATDVGGLTSTTSVMSFKTVTTQITPQNSPTSGYADPRNAIKFQWYFASTGGAVPQASATFYWRISGVSEWTSVAASGSTASVTIPANTFPVASTIEWYISGTDVGGTSSTSQVYSFSTAAETAYAYPQAPIGVTVDTGKAVTVHWILANADGTQPSRVELSYKLANESSWTTIHAENAAFTEWTTAAGYFPVGEIEWRVIATNRDGVEGPAGAAAFISLRAPDAPVGLTATAVPRTTIRWQGGDQEAYEILIDGETVQQAYGTEVNEWTPDFVLEDGIHVIAVRIQGPYGLWSDPSITTIDVQNQIPAGWEDLTLAGRFDVDAILLMSGAASPASPSANWFRDGKRIAVTHGSREYADRYVLGEHRYWVELWAEDGNYARSNVLTGTLKSCITRIALFEGGGWVDLKLSENSASEQGFTYGRTASARHVLGTAYPVLEVSEFEDLSGSYDCAFRDTESAAQLEAMRGRVVILKSRGGRVLIGLLSPLETRYTDFYIACRFTVTAIDWEDFRDVV